MWKLTKNHYEVEKQLVEESLFMVGNGYMGVRGCFEEGYPDGDSIRGTYINGLYDRVPMTHAEMAYGFPVIQDKQPRIADTQTCNIWLDGEQVQLYPGRYETYYRYLDYQKGESDRSYVFITKSGRKAHVKFTRMASFVYPHVFKYRIEVIFNGPIELKSVLDGEIENYANPLDPRTGSGHTQLMEIQRIGHEGNDSYVELKTKTTGIHQMTVVRHKVTASDSYTLEHESKKGKVTTSIIGRNHIILTKTCAFTDSLRFKRYYDNAYKILDAVESQDLEKLQQNHLDEYWRLSDIEIFGSDLDQHAIRFMQYQLLQSVGIDSFSNVSAKGLSGEGYEGHYFWDTEIYILPVLMLNQPERAKHLLEYRAHILDHARSRAIELGHRRGAAYAWRTISGIECSGYFPAGTAQYHINADIAYAFIQYFLMTNDWKLMVQTGAEVIFETARIWLEIGNFNNGLFHIHSVTGPDEYTAIVNDNYYTNAMAKYHLKWAHDLFTMLEGHEDAPIRERFYKMIEKISMDRGEAELMKTASNQMYLPYDDQLGIYAQDANFLKKPIWPFHELDPKKKPLLLHYHPLTIYRHQVLKQADTVLAHYLLEEFADETSIQNGFEYYEKITTHDSSLSSCIYGIMAARCGDPEKSYAYFEDSVALDLMDTHGNTKDGLHMANIAGSILSVLAGFAGFRNKDTGVQIRPILPPGWTGYAFKFRYLGTLIGVEVRNQVNIKLLVGESVKIHVYDQVHHLLKGEVLVVDREL